MNSDISHYTLTFINEYIRTNYGSIRLLSQSLTTNGPFALSTNKVSVSKGVIKNMRDKKPLLHLIFYSIASLLFFIDLGSFSLFEKPFMYALLCFYVLQLARPMSWPRITYCLLLLSLCPLIHYGRFGIGLIYLIPATFLGIKMRHTFYDTVWQYYLLLAACLLAQICLVEYFILGLPISVSYTISTIIANIVVIWIMSLKSYN